MHVVTDQTGRPADPTRPSMDPAEEIEMARLAAEHAQMLDAILLDIDDLDPVSCPPDRRFFLGEREAWVYDHGKIVDLVFVRSDPR